MKAKIEYEKEVNSKFLSVMTSLKMFKLRKNKTLSGKENTITQEKKPLSFPAQFNLKPIIPGNLVR